MLCTLFADIILIFSISVFCRYEAPRNRYQSTGPTYCLIIGRYVAAAVDSHLAERDRWSPTFSLLSCICAGHGLKVVPRLRECCRQSQAEVVSNSRNTIHQTWGPLFSRALYACEESEGSSIFPSDGGSHDEKEKDQKHTK